MKWDLDGSDSWALLLFALRYAFTRNSTAAVTLSAIVRQCVPELDMHHLAQLIQETKEAERALGLRAEKILGEDEDDYWTLVALADRWAGLVQDLELEMEKRREGGV